MIVYLPSQIDASRLDLADIYRWYVCVSPIDRESLWHDCINDTRIKLFRLSIVLTGTGGIVMGTGTAVTGAGSASFHRASSFRRASRSSNSAGRNTFLNFHPPFEALVNIPRRIVFITVHQSPFAIDGMVNDGLRSASEILSGNLGPFTGTFSSRRPHPHPHKLCGSITVDIDSACNRG